MSWRSASSFAAAATFLALWASVGCARVGVKSSKTLIDDDERAAIEAEILDLERQLDEAYEGNDAERYFSFYADDLTQFWDSGRVTLEQYRKDWTALIQGGGGVVESRTEDVHVRVSPLGDTAVVTYPIFARYRDAEGNESGGQYYETDVWFRQDGGWKMVHYHFSSAAQPEGQ